MSVCATEPQNLYSVVKEQLIALASRALELQRRLDRLPLLLPAYARQSGWRFGLKRPVTSPELLRAPASRQKSSHNHAITRVKSTQLCRLAQTRVLD